MTRLPDAGHLHTAFFDEGLKTTCSAPGRLKLFGVLTFYGGSLHQVAGLTDGRLFGVYPILGAVNTGVFSLGVFLATAIANGLTAIYIGVGHVWLLTHHVLVVVCGGLASKRDAMPLSSRGEE